MTLVCSCKCDRFSINAAILRIDAARNIPSITRGLESARSKAVQRKARERSLSVNTCKRRKPTTLRGSPRYGRGDVAYCFPCPKRNSINVRRRESKSSFREKDHGPCSSKASILQSVSRAIFYKLSSPLCTYLRTFVDSRKAFGSFLSESKSEAKTRLDVIDLRYSPLDGSILRPENDAIHPAARDLLPSSLLLLLLLLSLRRIHGAAARSVARCPPVTSLS